jgi:EAL domain-containing protein (putative c-di-GMP-specific phosphodiesterase class I)
MVRWEEAGLYVPKIAVNLSVRQFDRGGMANMVAGAARDRPGRRTACSWK